MRDNNWLQKQLDFLLKKYFFDVTLTNPLVIRFGREAKYRFGSIRLLKSHKGYKRAGRAEGLRSKFPISLFERKRDRFQFPVKKQPAKSIITITSMFAKEDIPVEVVHHTIAHELCHYAHGFSSTNRRLFKHPHHGGVVNAELKRRGAGELIIVFKGWLKEYRTEILASKNR